MSWERRRGDGRYQGQYVPLDSVDFPSDQISNAVFNTAVKSCGHTVESAVASGGKEEQGAVLALQLLSPTLLHLSASCISLSGLILCSPLSSEMGRNNVLKTHSLFKTRPVTWPSRPFHT